MKPDSTKSSDEPEKTLPCDPPQYTYIEGLTERRRKYLLSCKPPESKYSNILKKALIRMRGFRLWHKMLQEIRTFGTGSVLFDANNKYKANLSQIMRDKVLMIEKLSEDKIEESKTWVLHPDSKFHSIWTPIILFFVVYTFTLMPWIMAFEEVTIGNFWFFTETLTDLVFFFDIFVNLNSAYFDKEGKLVQTRLKIFLNYLTGWLLIDFVSIFPFNYIIINESNTNLAKFFRLVRILRVFRANKMRKVYKVLSETDTFSFLSTNQGSARLFGGLFVVLLFTHFFACTWFFTAKIDGFSPDSWVVRFNVQDKDTGYLYLCSLYYSCTVLTTVGFGDIHPGTLIEKLVSMCWMICGIGCYSFVVGNLSSVLSSLDQKQAFINEKLKLIQIFAEETQLPQHIALEIGNKVKEALVMTSLNDEERVSLVNKLSKNLRFEMATLMYDKAIKDINFFCGKDQLFVADIVPMLNFVAIKMKKLVYEKLQYADEMYFIKKGRVCFIYGNSSMIFKAMIQGSYFGEIELIENIPREFSAAAQCDCEFLVMSKSVFEYMMGKYPTIGIGMKNLAIERKRRILKCKKEVVDVLEKVTITKEFTFNDLAGTEKIRKNNSKTRSIHESMYLDRELQDIVGFIFDKIEEYDKVLTRAKNREYTGKDLKRRIKNLPPLPKLK